MAYIKSNRIKNKGDYIMGFDLNNLDKVHDYFKTEIDGSELEFGFKKPDHFEMIDFRKDNLGLSMKMQKMQKHVEEGDTENLKLDVSSEDYEPILNFLVNHTLKVKGLEMDGDGVSWSDLEEDMKRKIFKHMNPKSMWQYVGKISQSIKLEDEEGND